MAYAASGSVVRQIESLFEGGSVAGLSDRQLLERFTAQRDAAGEAAFAALVTRHGPMVLDVCRSSWVTGTTPRTPSRPSSSSWPARPGSIRDPDLLGNWLYGVALRTARMRQGPARPPAQERGGGAMWTSVRMSRDRVPPAEQPVLAREQAEALHDEIDRLPGSFRLPVVLCYFEGLTLDEAARRLRWPAGTVRSRLARARDKLRRGLTRRGVVLPAAVLAAALTPRSASASHLIPPVRHHDQGRDRSSRPDRPPPAVSASAAALAQEVLRSMLIHKLRLHHRHLARSSAPSPPARGYLTHSLAMKDEPKKTPAASQPPLAAKPDDTAKAPAPGRMFVVGRVLDPQGKPVPNATVMVHARVKRLGECRRSRRTESDRDRPRGRRRIGPVSARRAANVVVAERRVHGRRPGTWLRSRLGRARPRRRSARRRNHASTRASDPGAPLRPARPARPGRHGVGLHDRTRPPSRLGRLGLCDVAASKVRSTGGLASTTCRPGPSRRPPTPMDGSRSVAWAVASRPP